MKKIMNQTHLEGYLFSHSLEAKVTGENSKNPGTEYIGGSLEIATDDEGLNVVPVNFRFVTPKFKSGKANATYTTLQKVIESTGKTFTDCGTAAMKLKVDTALGLNDFYTAEGELVTYKLNDGGFVHIIPNFSDNRNSFEVDVLINNVDVKEADEERGTPDMVVIKGGTFNFANAWLPIELVVKEPAGMKFFEGLEATPSNPIFMKVWGHVTSSTIETQTVEESAFGEAAVKTSTRRLREWVVTGASAEPYDYGDEAILTAKEVQDAVAAREVYLADVKKRHDEYLASKGNTPAQAAPKAAPGGFNF